MGLTGGRFTRRATRTRFTGPQRRAPRKSSTVASVAVTWWSACQHWTWPTVSGRRHPNSGSRSRPAGGDSRGPGDAGVAPWWRHRRGLSGSRRCHDPGPARRVSSAPGSTPTSPDPRCRWVDAARRRRRASPRQRAEAIWSRAGPVGCRVRSVERVAPAAPLADLRTRSPFPHRRCGRRGVRPYGTP